MGIKLPNFLIVGAAKSGTTSLYYYLKQHPQIYMSPIKEPMFITAQFVKFHLMELPVEIVRNNLIRNIVKNIDEYKQLFENVTTEKAIGEASVENLYFYEGATKYIKKLLGDIKIIIILRNPVEAAFSHYLHNVRHGLEPLSFEDAIKNEQERKKNNWWFGYQIIDMGFYYKQVKAYLESFSQVKVYLYDDLVKDPLGFMKTIYEFLEVDASFVPDIKTHYNVSGYYKNKFLVKFFTKPNLLKTVIKTAVKPFFSDEKWMKLIESVRVKTVEKPQIMPETRKYLENIYQEDIVKLQDLINRDLSHWLR